MDNWRHDAVCEMQMHNIICIKKKSVDALRTYRRAHEKTMTRLKGTPAPRLGQRELVYLHCLQQLKNHSIINGN